MLEQISALLLLATIFAIGTVRKVHIGILAFVAAAGVGVLIAGMKLKNVISGFPIGILILLAGVTFFFGIAHENGTIRRIIDRAIHGVGDRAALLPFVFFALACGIAAMGSSLASLALAPIGMPLAHRYRIDPVLMGLSIGTGLTAGAFAPTSLFGIITYGTASGAGIDLDPMVLFAVSLVANIVLLAVAFAMFGGLSLPRGSIAAPSLSAAAANSAPLDPDVKFEPIHLLTIFAIAALFATVLTLAVLGIDPDIGVLCFCLGAILLLIDPDKGKGAVGRIDWSTILMVGGVITYVGVLQKMGAVDFLGHSVSDLGAPLFSALALCVIGGLISAFASTTGMLAAIVPMALPLITRGDLSGWGVICALAVCSALVDVAPYSTVGATFIATSEPAERPRVTSILMRWGMSMVIIGPVVLIGVLVLPGALLGG